MAAESFIVTNSDGTTDLTFNRQSLTGSKSRWSCSVNTVSDRLFIDIDHQMKPSGSLGTDTHLVTFRHEKINSSTGANVVASVGFVVKVPRDTTIPAATIGDLISNFASLLSKNFMLTFINGDTPSGDYNVTGPFNPVRQ